MSMDGRLLRLEAAIRPQEAIAIRVCRLPPEAMALDGQDQDDWIREHPECIQKVIEVPAGGRLQ